MMLCVYSCFKIWSFPDYFLAVLWWQNVQTRHKKGFFFMTVNGCWFLFPCMGIESRPSAMMWTHDWFVSWHVNPRYNFTTRYKNNQIFSCKSWNELCTTGLWFPARSQVTMDSFPTIPAMGQGFAATVGKLFLIKAGLCSGTYWYRWVKYSWALNLLLSWRYMAQYLLFRILKWPVTQLSML